MMKGGYEAVQSMWVLVSSRQGASIYFHSLVITYFHSLVIIS